MVFKSKYDWIYCTLMVVIVAITLFFSNLAFVLGLWYISILLTLMLVFVFHIFVWRSIVLIDDAIEIRFGFFKKKIPYARIQEIKQTKNLISSHATSRNRIGIRTGERVGILNYTYISPESSEEFILSLKEKVGENVIFTLSDKK